MDIDRLEEFLLIAEQRSFKRSAALLGVSQAVLSARIAALEKSMGVRLLERDAHRVELTDKGLQFLPDAQSIVASYQKMKGGLSTIRYNRYRSLKLAISGALMPARVGPYLDEVNMEHPDIHIELMDDHDFGVLQGLNEGLCDAYLTYGKSGLSFPHIERALLYTAQPCALVNRAHPLSNRAHISLRELDGERFVLYPPTAELSIRELESALLERSGIAYTTYDDPVSPLFYQLLVPIGKAIAICPWVVRDTLPPNTVPLMIDDAADAFNMYLFYRADAPNPFFSEFLGGLTEFDKGRSI